eukprot:gene5635-7013_t
MIREYIKEKDEDTVIDIWLSASIKAHNFISAEYWSSKVDDMRNIYIPSSKTYVYTGTTPSTTDNTTIGFISIVEDSYIAAVFVSPDHQGKGIGGQLIDHVKKEFKGVELRLGVYEKNVNSVSFYKKQGFTVLSSKPDENTGEIELIMTLKCE